MPLHCVLKKMYLNLPITSVILREDATRTLCVHSEMLRSNEGPADATVPNVKQCQTSLEQNFSVFILIRCCTFGINSLHRLKNMNIK